MAKESNATAVTEHTRLSILWATLVLLCSIQLCTSMDGAVLSNATSALVSDFGASIAKIQITNTVYPLTAGAFMIISGLLGLIVGWNILLNIGLVILTVGEITAYLSSNIDVLTYVARFLTGLGASAAIPAVLALITSLYGARLRIIAFSAIAATNGLATAFGPIVGGLIIVHFGWRAAFLLLAVLFGASLLCSMFIPRAQKQQNAYQFDNCGSILVVIALTLFCFGLLQINQWGLIYAYHPTIQIMGFSPCLPLITCGIVLFLLFLYGEKKREKNGLSVILPSVLLNTPQTMAGLYLTGLTFFLLGGLSFLLVAFMQMVIGYNPVHTGIALVPLASGMLIFSLGTSCMLKTQYPRLTCRIGVAVTSLSYLIICVGIQETSISWLFLLGLFFSGAGLGFIASQSSVAITLAVPEGYAEQSAGVQGSVRNIGQALGVACVGLLFISILSHTIREKSTVSTELTVEVKQKTALMRSVPLLSDKEVSSILEKMHITGEDAADLVDINSSSRLIAMRASLLFLTIVTLLFWRRTRDLPQQISNAG